MDTVTRYKEAPLRGLIGWEMRHLKITNGVVAGNQIPLFAQRTRDSHVRGQTLQVARRKRMAESCFIADGPKQC